MTNATLQRILWRHYRSMLLSVTLIMGITGVKAATDLANQSGRLFSGTGYVTTDSNLLMMAVSLIMAMVLGWLMFIWDNHTNFNHYLLALPVTRRRLYRQKVGLFMGMFVVSYVVMQAIFLGLLKLIKQPQASYNLNWGTDLRYVVSQLVCLVAILSVCSIWGLWLGQTISSALATVIFMGSLPFAYDGVANITALLAGKKDWSINPLALIDQSTWPGFAVLVMIGSLVWVGCYYSNRWAFERLSLESTGDFLVFPQLRPVFLWLVIAYLTVAVSFSSFGILLVSIVTNHYRATLPWYQNVILAVIVAYLTWSIGRLVLYRPDHPRAAFKFQRLTHSK